VYPVLAAYLGARLLYAQLFGVRFETGALWAAWQHLDVVVLQSQLLEGLSALHAQPPLFNLFLGVLIALAPAGALATVFDAIYGMLTLGALVGVCASPTSLPQYPPVSAHDNCRQKAGPRHVA